MKSTKVRTLGTRNTSTVTHAVHVRRGFRVQLQQCFIFTYRVDMTLLESNVGDFNVSGMTL